MKATLAKMGLVLSVLFVSSHANANSYAMTIAGAAFDNYNHQDSLCAERYNNGIRNDCLYDAYMVLGISKGYSSNGYAVTLEGNHTSTATTNFTVYSYSHDGTFLGSLSNNATNVSGNWARTCTLNLNQAPGSSRLTALIRLPASLGGIAYGLTLAY